MGEPVFTVTFAFLFRKLLLLKRVQQVVVVLAFGECRTQFLGALTGLG